MNTVLEKFFPVLQKSFPHLQREDVIVYENGHDHFVFVIGGKHTFRFPRSRDHGKQDSTINMFSHIFASLSPLPIQIMTGHVDTETGLRYQTYEFIQGIPLTRELARSLSRKELQSIAKDMGKFLKTLHSFPVDQVEKMGVESLISPQDYADYFVDVIELDKKFILKLLTTAEWEWFVQNVFEFKKTSYEHPYPFAVTHSDMLPEHILIDEKTHRLSGIIDFTLRIADPANDFKYFDRYGKGFLDTVYENYLPVDNNFDGRRKFYARDLPVAKLYESVSRNDEEIIQESYRKELKDYIASDTLSS